MSHDQIGIDFDALSVTIRDVHDVAAPAHHHFQWTEVERVCFADDGLAGSDVVYIVIRGRKNTIAVPLEAPWGRAFFGALTERGLFPEAVWRGALAGTSRGMHCWPPFAEEVVRRKRAYVVNTARLSLAIVGAGIARSWALVTLVAAWALIFVWGAGRLRRWGRSPGR